jgi:HEPN domain-containing protein
LRFNPRREVEYRIELATRFLEEAEKAWSSGDWRRVVESSQLASENAAKSVIAIYRIPSWSHDPYEELVEISLDLNPKYRKPISRLAEIAHELAPEHGRVIYGEPGRGVTPWDLYSREDAENALDKAREAVKTAKNLITLLK